MFISPRQRSGDRGIPDASATVDVSRNAFVSMNTGVDIFDEDALRLGFGLNSTQSPLRGREKVPSGVPRARADAANYFPLK